jgi:CheY-like chemotaxis protein
MDQRPNPALRILVVDDNSLNRRVARATLKHLGYDAAEATSGPEALAALAALATQHFDLIFMDVQMPDMDGLETTRKIRAQYADRNIVIVALTADATRAACLASGMNAHLHKPISLPTLKSLLESLSVAA